MITLGRWQRSYLKPKQLRGVFPFPCSPPGRAQLDEFLVRQLGGQEGDPVAEADKTATMYLISPGYNKGYYNKVSHLTQEVAGTTQSCNTAERTCQSG